jgi:glycosyltransferase involved in cell wall biosynthesis
MRFPHVRFFLYSNDDIEFPSLQNVVQRTSSPKRRGVFWQHTQLLDMIHRDSPDVYWATNGLLPAWGLRNAVRVLTVHDFVHEFAPATQQRLNRWNRRVFQSIAIRRATRVIAASDSTAAEMQQLCGRRADFVIRPLAARHFSRPERSELERVRGKLELPPSFWLVVGTLEPRKNIANLIDAHLRCRSRGLNLPPLLVVGDDGWLNADIEKAIRQPEASGHIRRMGYVATGDLPALYSLCDLLLLPSIYEGFGMPILEAQMCGAPVVHGNHSSMIEAGGQLGVAVPPDLASLERALAQLSIGELPLVCRLPSDPSIPSSSDAVAKLAMAFGLEPRRT